jgi:hypothetical protein
VSRNEFVLVNLPLLSIKNLLARDIDLSYCDIQFNVSATRLFACESIEYTTLHVFDVHSGSEIYTKSSSSSFVRVLTEPASSEAPTKTMKEASNVGMPKQDLPLPAHSLFQIASLTGTGARTRDLLSFLHRT